MIKYRWWRRLCVYFGYRSFFKAKEWPEVKYFVVTSDVRPSFIQTMLDDGWIEEFD